MPTFSFPGPHTGLPHGGYRMPSIASDPILLLTTLYSSRKMEKDGVVESSWETSTGGPARRKYAITNAGEARLGLWAESLGQYQQTMNTFFGLYAGTAPHADEYGND